MNPFDTLAKASPNMIVGSPFPYIVINNALPSDIYQKLDSTFPVAAMTNDGDTAFQARRYSNNQWKDVDYIWQQFHDYHDSIEFKNKLLDLFKEYIDEEKYQRYYTNENSVPEEIKSFTTFTVNGMSTIKVQTPHVDHAGNFYVGLYYMRDNQDQSLGGDLEIYESTVENVEFGEYRKPRQDHIAINTVVPYQANTQVWMLTGPRAIHGASARQNASVFRKYVNINTRVDVLAHPYNDITTQVPLYQ